MRACVRMMRAEALRRMAMARLRTRLVGVQLERELAVRLLDVGSRALLADAKHFVVPRIVHGASTPAGVHTGEATAHAAGHAPEGEASKHDALLTLACRTNAR